MSKPWDRQGSKTVVNPLEASTRGLAAGDSLATTGADGVSADAEMAQMDRRAALRRQRPHRDRGSLAGRAMGKKLGRAKLLWLKRNWVLVALVLFALLGFIIMLILVTQPCAPNIVKFVESYNLSTTQATVQVVKTCEGEQADGSPVAVGFQGCPTGFKIGNVTQCDTFQCSTLNSTDGTPVPDPNCRNCMAGTGECVEWRDKANDLCAKRYKSCQRSDVRMCKQSEMCVSSTGDTLARGCNPVQKCVDKFDLTNQTYTITNDGQCPEVKECFYCKDSVDPFKLHSVVENAGGSKSCPPGSHGPNVEAADAVTSKCKAVVKCLDPFDPAKFEYASNGTCPTVQTCKYCYDTTDKTTLHPVNSDGKTCPTGSGPTISVEKPESDGKCRQFRGQADFDGQLMIDYSGSLGATWNAGVNYFPTEMEVSAEVVKTFNSKLGGKGASFRMGAFTWSSNIQGPLSASLTNDVDSVRQAIIDKKDTTPSGGTFYAPPLSKCATEVRDTASGASSKEGAYKMCMLITDGGNDDDEKDNDLCTKDSCKTFCNNMGVTTCNIDNIVVTAKSTGVKLVGVFAQRSGAELADQWNLFCHTSCTSKKPSECRDEYSTMTASARKALQDNCHYFLEGDLTDQATLTAKLTSLSTTIVAEVESTVESEPPATVSEGSNSTAAPPVVIQNDAVVGQVQGAEKDILTDSANVTVDNDLTETDKREECVPAQHLWLLIFFIPLIAYLLYYPCKRRRDARKRRLRALLLHRAHAQMAQKKAALEKVKREHEEREASIAAEEAAAGKKKKKYKWDIEHSDQYLWSSSTGGSMRVNFGKALPPSAPKQDASKKVLKTQDGQVLKGAEVDKAVAEMKQEEERKEAEKLDREIALAEKLAEAGELGDDGEFWVRCCPCCQTVLEDGYYDKQLALRGQEVQMAAAVAPDVP